MFLSGDKTKKMLIQGLDAAALRHRVTANNLANLNTPRFQRSDVSFEEQLRKARQQEAIMPLFRTHQTHFPLPAPGEVVPVVKKDTTTVRRIDGNNVDLEREMLNMVTNQLRYNAYTQQLNTRLDKWRFVINEGRR